MPILLDQGCSLGWRRTGRTVLGYTLTADGQVVQARQLVNVVEVISDRDPGDLGNYECAPDAGLSIPEGFHGTIVWDDPETGVTDSHTIDLGRTGILGEGGGSGDSGDDLPDAIVTRVYAIEPIISRLPGGFWWGAPANDNDGDTDNDTPYGSLSLIIERVESYGAMGRGDDGMAIGGPAELGYRAEFQISLVGPDASVLLSIHREFLRWFHPRMSPFPIAGRIFRRWFNDNLDVDTGDAPASASGLNLSVLRWDVEILTNTARPT